MLKKEEEWIPVIGFLLKKAVCSSASFFCMTFRCAGLLEVCMMTHREPLSPLSTTHEPWPLIPHIWVWDAVAVATSVGTEAAVSRGESVCRCVETAVVEGCERKPRVDASLAHNPASIWGLAACSLSSGTCRVKRVFVWGGGWGGGISVTHLSSCFPAKPLLCHRTFIHQHVKLIHI